MTVSIVIPAYNEERYLKSCLDAIAAQSVAPHEVIVVDNNSTDNTAKLVASYSFARLITEKKQGSMYAHTAGLNAATGELIGRIDADTILAADWVEQIQVYFVAHPEAAAVTGHCYFYDFRFRKFTAAMHRLVYYDFQRIFAGTEILWGANMAITRSAWRKVRKDCHVMPGIDEDIDLSLCLRRQRQSIGRNAKLQAGVSLRRQGLSPVAIARYLSTWPRDYWVNSMPLRAVIIFVVTWLMIIAGSIASLVLLAVGKRY